MGEQTALVTGASSGIGEQFALKLGRRGHNLILTARSVDKMQMLATRLRTENPGIGVEVIAADLAEPGGSAALAAELTKRGIDVDILVNNAGFGSHNPVAEEDPDNLAREIQLNCSSLVDLTARLLPAMLQRDWGGVLNVASTAAFQPLAGMAVYGATKAFVLSFTEALWAETRTTGVRVVALCPGATETGFFDAAGKEFLTSGRQTADHVAEFGLHAFFNGRGPTVVPGLANKLGATGYRFVPRAALARFAGARVRADH
ncbi:MAG: SDR family oxidoreductase [Mycobacterium sp.]|nr:SDR family oxidoreductase [Mycobacterium sp.]